MSTIDIILEILRRGKRFLEPGVQQQQPVVVNVNQVKGHGASTVPMVMPPNVYAPPHYIVPEMGPAQFTVSFEPLDDVTFEDLDEEDPVVVFVFDPDVPEETIYSVTELGQGIDDCRLYPGRYGLLAIVYVDDDFDEISGIGVGEFDIEAGEPPFDLRVPITSDEDMIASVLGTETAVIGNRRSHIYHLSYCPGAYQIAANNRVIFPSQEAAEDDGYDPCLQCVGDDDYY